MKWITFSFLNVRTVGHRDAEGQCASGGTRIWRPTRKWATVSLVLRAFLVGQVVKTLPAMQETWVRFLGQEDILEQEMATHSSILAWRILWTEEPGGLQSMGSQRFGHNRVTNTIPAS